MRWGSEEGERNSKSREGATEARRTGSFGTEADRREESLAGSRDDRFWFGEGRTADNAETKKMDSKQRPKDAESGTWRRPESKEGEGRTSRLKA